MPNFGNANEPRKTCNESFGNHVCISLISRGRCPSKHGKCCSKHMSPLTPLIATLTEQLAKKAAQKKEDVMRENTEERNECMHKGGECQCISPASCEKLAKNCSKILAEKDSEKNCK